MKKPFYKRWWFWAVVAFVVIGAVGSSLEAGQEPAQSPAPTVEITSPPTPTPTPTPTPEPTPEPEPTASPAPEPEAAEALVWIPQTGSKYHSSPDCSNMKDPAQVTLSQAEALGYEPCKRCFG